MANAMTTARSTIAWALFSPRSTRTMAARTQPPQDHNRGQRPSEVPHEGAAQLEDDRRRHAAERPETKHLPEYVDARARDHDGDDHLGGVGEPNGEQVSDQDGKAQGSRLPVEREGHPQTRCRGSTGEGGPDEPGSTPRFVHGMKRLIWSKSVELWTLTFGTLLSPVVWRMSYGPRNVPWASAGTRTKTPATTTPASPKASKMLHCPRDRPASCSDESTWRSGVIVRDTRQLNGAVQGARANRAKRADG